MTQVTETIVLPDGTPAEGVTIRWTLVGATRAFLSGDDETVLSTLTVKTDQNGEYLVDLPANSDLNPSDTLWRRTIVGGERFGTVEDLVEVPDSGGPYVVEDILV